MCLHLCCGLICLFYGIGNRFYLGIGHGLMTRKTKLTQMDALSYGERQMVPLTVATLPVRRYGIMDDGAYALVGKMIAQGIAVIAQYRIDMHHIISIAERYGADPVHSDSVVIILGDSLPTGIVTIKVS